MKLPKQKNTANADAGRESANPCIKNGKPKSSCDLSRGTLALPTLSQNDRQFTIIRDIVWSNQIGLQVNGFILALLITMLYLWFTYILLFIIMLYQV